MNGNQGKFYFELETCRKFLLVTEWQEMKQTAESDWKKFKQVRELALQRYCERVLLDLQAISSDTRKSANERYLEIFKLIDDRNENLAYMFDNPRRSCAEYQLAAMYSHEIVTAEEIAGFGEEIRNRLLRRLLRL